MDTLVLYHANCTDGFGAAYAAWASLGDKGVTYLPVNYNEAPPDVKGKRVYILDFSYPQETLLQMVSDAYHVTLIDHHKTAFEELGFGDMERIESSSDKLYLLLDKKRSGAYLAWQFFHEEAVPELIELIDDYDRWQFNLLSTKAVHKGLWAMTPWSMTQWRDLNISDVEEKGDILLKDHDKKVQQLLKEPVQVQINGLSGYAANAPSFFASDLGHHLALKSGTYGLVWSMNKDGQAQCSLRSNGDYDVSAIARQFGGGGHKNAAGMRVDINSLIEFICSNS